MLNEIEKTICGKSFKIKQFPARLSLQIFFRLIKTAKILVPALAELGEGKSLNDVMELNTKDVNIFNMFSGIIEKIDPEELTNLLCELVSSCSVKTEYDTWLSLSTNPGIDECFSDIGQMFNLAFEVVKFNYYKDGEGFFFNIITKIKTIIPSIQQTSKNQPIEQKSKKQSIK